MSVSIKSGASGDLAGVDANKNLNVVTPQVAAQAGYSVGLFENDDGTFTGVKERKSPYVTPDQRLSVGVDTLLMNETFNMTAQNTSRLRSVVATMTNSFNTTGIILNANSALVASNGTQLSTWRQFPLLGNAALKLKTSIAITQAMLANQVIEFGLFPFAAGNVAPSEGVFIRLTSAGLIGAMTFNGTETTTGPLAVSFVDNRVYQFRFTISEREVKFWRDDILIATLEVPTANGQPFITTALPFSWQFRNSGTVSGSPVAQMRVTDASVSQMSLNLGKPFPHIAASHGSNSSQAQDGATMGSTALMTNNLAPGAGVVMTNTTAALGVGLGGQFASLPTLAANTDGIVCSYQNPVGTVNQTPRTLYITGMRISSMVTTVLAGGPVQNVYSLAFGHTNVSLATSEAVAAKAARRIPLGMETFALNAAVGTIGTPGGITIPFETPVVVNPGEFIALAAKNVGVVTTTGVITYLVSFNGYWE